ncbi:hypothetical protein F2P81_002655 [Scophthalmus maximus]|uniref:Uncharacterized protein n=1 Tax=Scophthalmus maximus TaxID=52904 RepID=A0A6A4TEY4_SCOMX|nr:hypothetical protein F2P81_002655 [Scophthalmus maximus]
MKTPARQPSDRLTDVSKSRYGVASKVSPDSTKEHWQFNWHVTKLLGEEKYFSLQRVSEAEFGDERNTNNRGMNVRSQLDFLAGHVFESTDLLRSAMMLLIQELRVECDQKFRERLSFCRSCFPTCLRNAHKTTDTKGIHASPETPLLSSSSRHFPFALSLLEDSRRPSTTRRRRQTQRQHGPLVRRADGVREPQTKGGRQHSRSLRGIGGSPDGPNNGAGQRAGVKGRAPELSETDEVESSPASYRELSSLSRAGANSAMLNDNDMATGLRHGLIAGRERKRRLATEMRRPKWGHAKEREQECPHITHGRRRSSGRRVLRGRREHRPEKKYSHVRNCQHRAVPSANRCRGDGTHSVAMIHFACYTYDTSTATLGSGALHLPNGAFCSFDGKLFIF